MSKAKVSLIGAGPGDIGLLTIKAKERIENADLILYDRLINKSILDYAKINAVVIDVGKGNIDKGKLQNDINKKLVKYSRKYKNIVRLKGGDPFLFGRGGEEAEILKKNNIDFEIVPGITSAISVPAYAGIPVTHRDYSSELHVFTGHSKDGLVNINFKKIALLDGTLVFLMGVKNIFGITEGLLKNGKESKTPVAVIENGTTPRQKVLISTLGNIKNDLTNNKVNPPSIIIVGDVVSLNKKLNWFNEKTLYGKKILVTRASLNSDDLSSKFVLHGADVIEIPFIKIDDESNKKINKNFISKLKDYSIILFNSANGVRFFFNKLNTMKMDTRVLCSCKIGVVGAGTKKAIEKFNIIPDIIPAEYTVEKLIEESINIYKDSTKILIITSNLSPVNTSLLKEKYNICFDKLELYKTVEKKIRKKEIESLSDKIDLITFCSSSTVRSFFKNIKKLDKSIKIASIGPITSETIRSCGYKVNIEAKNYCMDGLIDAIVDYYS